MKSTIHRRVAQIALAIALSGAFSCSILAAKPDPSQFYVLTAAAPPESGVAPSRAAGSISLGLGPIHLPDYVKRPTLVVRSSETQIQPSPIDRWGEPLDKGFPRVLQENLRRELGTDRVVLFPWYESDAPASQVQIDVLRFDRDPDNRAVLVARWEIRELGTKAPLLARETRVTREAATPRTAAGVEALSATLADLSHEIALAVAGLPHASR